MTTPLPGKRVRGSQSGRPIMALLDLLGRRWALRILWELRDGKALTFRELGARCGGLSPAVENGRLAELREAGLVRHEAGGYRLTAEGKSLLARLGPLHDWAETWAKNRAARIAGKPKK
jgi:DNA-binding HxlR family transcriptional regulator